MQRLLLLVILIGVNHFCFSQHIGTCRQINASMIRENLKQGVQSAMAGIASREYERQYNQGNSGRFTGRIISYPMTDIDIQIIKTETAGK